MEKILNVYDIKFNHDRGRLGESMQGDILEEAAKLSSDILDAKLDGFLLKLDNFYSDHQKDSVANSSEMLELAIKNATTPQELVYFIYAVGFLDGSPIH